MKKNLLSNLLCSVLLLSGLLANAREEMNKPHKSGKASFKTEAGDCVTPTAQFDLDVNNVRARLLTGGDAWWNLSEARYEVPKGDGSGKSLNAIFAGAIWITGYDAGGNLKCAAQRYRQGGDDYWPGPLSNGVIDKATCNKYDRFFNVYGSDIAKAQNAFLTKGSALTLADIPKSVLSWPGKGNAYLQTDPTLVGETFDITDNLAPFKDVNADGIYDPMTGDYPVIPCRGKEAEAYADQMIFWVFNDMGNLHTESNGQSIGIQVNALAFAFQTTDEINSMTFYKYEITNKSANNLSQTYISQWADPDLGCFSNDRVGCDVSRSLGIVYNDGNDPDCNGVGGYGAQLPLIGIDFFEGPLGDDSLRTELGLTSFVYFTNGATSSQADPGSAAQYRNYQTGFWNDGTPFTNAGTGYNNGTPTNYIFSGEPCVAGSWSDYSSGQPAGDRRFVQTSGPFTLKSGEPQYVTVGVVFVRPAGGVGTPPCFSTTIGPADDKAQLLFRSCFKLLDGPDAPTLQIRELSNQFIINLQNEIGNNKGEGYDEPYAGAVQYVNQYLGGNGDTTYTFEGYKIYQVSDAKVSATDLDDPTKALLYAQVDVKNGVKRVINFEKDAVLGLIVPVQKVDGGDAGISSSFNITQDLFASGTNKALINHKTYYYTAVAYAYNNYLAYDQSAPNGNAQLTPYLQGRGNFKIYSAIPHIPDPRNEGTILNSKWGDGVAVKRIEGSGNGGNPINLTAETIEKIVTSSSSFTDTLDYVIGSDPIGFKVTDPVSLKEADFELQFIDTTQNSIMGVSTTWVLRDLTNQVTINGDRPLDRPYEQQIFTLNNGEKNEYGFSIKLGTPDAVYTIPGNYLATTGAPARYVYGSLPSVIEYQNPVEPWLSFVKDEGVNTVTNWIRSGTNLVDASGANASAAARATSEVFDDNWYYTTLNQPSIPATDAATILTDPNEVFESIADGKWAPYCLAGNYSKKNLTTAEQDARKPPFIYQPGFKWKSYGQQTPPQNTLDRLASVDIVITPDVTKWTRCVVFETGEDEGINLGAAVHPSGKAARKGQIRMAYSKDWNSPSRDYLVETQSDTGRSWFPGYAVNIETGERLNIAFGESSDQGDQNGRDMLWNPTKEVYSPLTLPGQIIDRVPYFGGKHFIYVMGTKYDEGAAAQRLLLDNYANIGGTPLFLIPTPLRTVYQNLMWTSIPYLTPGYSFADDGHGNKIVPPAEVKIKLRVEKPFARFATNASNGVDSLPRYHFSTKGLGATEKNKEVAKSALDIVRIVPNPYLAYSTYETDQNTNRVKITNLPNKCTVTIYSLDGTLIRRLSRAIDVDPATNKKIEISDGAPVSDVNIDNSLDWDLKNDKGIAISSGIYLFQVEAPGIGQRTLKWFGAVRPADTSNF